MKPTVLSVEDEPKIQASICRTLETPPRNLTDTYGDTAFSVSRASTAAEAEKLLREAQRAMCPYDVLLLDLGLPEDSSSTEAPATVGLRLLRLVRGDHGEGGELSGACNAVIVQTAFTEIHYIRHAIRADAADFVNKPFANYEIYSAVVAAYRKSCERHARHWYELQRRQRQLWIVAQACGQVADRIATAISDRLETVQTHSDEVAREIEDRFQFDFQRDLDEVICQEVRELNTATRQVAEVCGKLSPQLQGDRAGLAEICVEEMVRETLSGLRSGLNYKRLRLDVQASGRHVIKSFADEVESVVREVIFGAIEASPDGAPLRISVTDDRKGGFVEVAVTDGGDAVDLARMQNVEVDWTSDNERIQILSLVERVAKSIGGRLSITGGRGSNTVILQFTDASDGHNNLNCRREPA